MSNEGTFSPAVGAVRSFATVLVVAHHAVLAYNPFAPPPQASLADMPQMWRAFPVFDPSRWEGFGLFNTFCDVFFMSLLFFVSGLFVWPSLQKKGPRAFLRDRILRLGVPFVVLAGIVAPLAYLPSYLQTGAHDGYLHALLAAGPWPSGPAWFLWVLLAFDGLATLVFLAVRAKGGSPRRPLAFFALLLVASALAYVPLGLVVSPFDWSVFGPFVVQTGRLLHYGVYFAAGIIAGAAGTELFATDGRLARRWPFWLGFCVVAFFAAMAIFGAAFSSPTLATLIAANLAFVVSCGASSFAVLAVFARYARRPDPMRRDAYGVYIFHYAFVSWIALALVGTAVPALAKGFLVTAGALAASWALTAALRRIPLVARVL